jgi:hypothetical protein
MDYAKDSEEFSWPKQENLDETGRSLTIGTRSSYDQFLPFDLKGFILIVTVSV